MFTLPKVKQKKIWGKRSMHAFGQKQFLTKGLKTKNCILAVNELICQVLFRSETLRWVSVSHPVSDVLKSHIWGRIRKMIVVIWNVCHDTETSFSSATTGEGFRFQHRVLLAQSENKSFWVYNNSKLGVPVLWGQIPHFRGAPFPLFLWSACETMFKRPHTR